MATFSTSISSVTCCTAALSPVNATCGSGLSCSAVCNMHNAFLCPSGDCADCEHIEEQGTEMEVGPDSPLESRGSCVSTSSSADCNYCVWQGCRVLRSPECCYHPICAQRRCKRCAWAENYLGEDFMKTHKLLYPGSSCPPPGDIPNGEWICEALEVPIPKVQADGGLTTYKSKALNISFLNFVQHSSVDWSALLGMSQTLHQW